MFASDEGGGLGTRDTDMVLLLGAPATTAAAAAAAADAAAFTDPDEPAATDTLAVCCGEHSLTTGSLKQERNGSVIFFNIHFIKSFR